MRINFKKKVYYNNGDEKLFKKFAWFPILVYRSDLEKSLVWLESYISFKRYNSNYHKTETIVLGGIFCGTIANIAVNLPFILGLHTFEGLFITIPLHLFVIYLMSKNWHNKYKCTYEYALTIYKSKYPEFFNKNFNNKLNKLINE